MVSSAVGRLNGKPDRFHVEPCVAVTCGIQQCYGVRVLRKPVRFVQHAWRFQGIPQHCPGFGTVGVRNGEPFVDVKSGTIPFEKIVYEAAG